MDPKLSDEEAIMLEDWLDGLRKFRCFVYQGDWVGFEFHTAEEFIVRAGKADEIYAPHGIGGVGSEEEAFNVVENVRGVIVRRNQVRKQRSSDI